MGSPCVLDLESLLSDIPGGNPAGVDLREDYSPKAVFRVLKDARAAARAAERNVVWEDDQSAGDKADWSPDAETGPSGVGHAIERPGGHRLVDRSSAAGLWVCRFARRVSLGLRSGRTLLGTTLPVAGRRRAGDATGSVGGTERRRGRWRADPRDRQRADHGGDQCGPVPFGSLSPGIGSGADRGSPEAGGANRQGCGELSKRCRRRSRKRRPRSSRRCGRI